MEHSHPSLPHSLPHSCGIFLYFAYKSQQSGCCARGRRRQLPPPPKNFSGSMAFFIHTHDRSRLSEYHTQLQCAHFCRCICTHLCLLCISSGFLKMAPTKCQKCTKPTTALKEVSGQKAEILCVPNRSFLCEECCLPAMHIRAGRKKGILLPKFIVFKVTFPNSHMPTSV